MQTALQEWSDNEERGNPGLLSTCLQTLKTLHPSKSLALILVAWVVHRVLEHPASQHEVTPYVNAIVMAAAEHDMPDETFPWELQAATSPQQVQT